jgi:hypothetical protein
MEATGAYWLSLAMYLVRQGYAASRINPVQAHYFAKALLKQAKTNVLVLRVGEGWRAGDALGSAFRPGWTDTATKCSSGSAAPTPALAMKKLVRSGVCASRLPSVPS